MLRNNQGCDKLHQYRSISGIQNIALCTLLVVGCVHAARSQGATIAENSAATAVIVIAEGATEAERHAANELAALRISRVTPTHFTFIGLS